MSTTTLSSSLLPVIQISLAPPEEPQPEPYSPFTPLPSGSSCSNSRVMDDSYRPSLLTPPVQSWSLSPLRPLSERRPKPSGQGLKDDHFQALLRASKERSTAAASKKQDLRKEVALKAHKNKQLERRALFLSKIGAPPSPTATSLPKTPPDSPAIFHYSLPSPGLCSPLALFEKLGLDDQDPEERGVRKIWVEQVDFRLSKHEMAEPEDEPEEIPAPVQVETPSITLTTPEEVEQDLPRPPFQRGHARKRSIPSLEQITERFSAQAVDTAAPTPTRPRAPLPAFLNSRRQSPSPPLPTEVPMVTVTAPSEPTRPRLTCTGRIRFPSRSPSPPSDSDTSVATSKPLPALPSDVEAAFSRRRMGSLPPTPPTPPCLPALEIRTVHVPRTESTSPVHCRLTEANLLALNSRASTAREMLSTIRRRTTVISSVNGRMQMYPPAPGTPPPMWRSTWQVEDEKHRRRHSAPAELAKAERMGFTHPVLALPAGF